MSIRSKHFTIEMEVPNESPWKGDIFYEKYDLLENAYYRIDDQSPIKVFKGTKVNQKCSLCGKGKDEVSFKSTSHLLPESLGNNKYISNEECDSCNDLYGEEFEGVLAIMFGFYRVFRGIRGKTKVSKDSQGNKSVRRIPKIKISNSEEIRFDEINQTLTLTSQLGDSSSIIKGDSHLEITAPIERHQPAKGVLSLLKSAWLLINEEQRLKYPNIIQALKDTDDLTPFEYFSVFFPGVGFPLVELNVYGVKDSTEDLPKVIITFSFLNNMLIWNSNRDAPDVFPPVHMPIHKSNDMSCTLRKHVLPNVNHETNGKTETHHIQFDSMLKTEAKEVKEKVQKERQQISYPKGKIKLVKDGAELTASMTIFRFDCECTSFKISGDEFGGSIIYEEFKNFNKNNSKFNFSLPSVSIDSALKTVLFFQDCNSVNAKFSIIGEPDKEIIYTVDNIQMDMSNENLLETWIDICTMIKVLNSEFSHDLRFPHKISNDEIRSLRNLTQAIQYGQLEEEYSTAVSFKGDFNFKVVRQIIEAVNKDQKIEVNNKIEFRIMNKVFGPFDELSWLKKPIVKVNNILVKKGEMPTYEDNENVGLEVQCFQVLRKYPKWCNSTDSSLN